MARYKKDLDDLLDEWQVHSPKCWENELSNTILKDWYAVSNKKGIVAYFGNGKDAFRFRLSEINRKLNG